MVPPCFTSARSGGALLAQTSATSRTVVASYSHVRPVVILSKFNLDACLVVPLTAKLKKGKYYFSVGDVSGRDAVAVLSQIRFVDRKRLAVKIATMDQNTFDALTKAVVKASFPNLKL